MISDSDEPRKEVKAPRDRNLTRDPVEIAISRKRIQFWFGALLVVVALAGAFYWTVFAESTVDYVTIDEHFKYGSIGSERYSGIPDRIWKALPELFPHHLPEPDQYLSIPASQRDYLDGYRQFGFVTEEGRAFPIGFSERKRIVNLVGLNCAVCHVGTVRVSESQAMQLSPESAANNNKSGPVAIGGKLDDSQSKRVIVLGMPAHTVDLTRYFQFLFACASDPGFTTDQVLAEMEAQAPLGWLDRFTYKRAVTRMREDLLARRGQLDWMYQNPEVGPGRVDTFNPYWTMVFNYPWNGTNGVADFPSLWNQRPRHGMHLHWDGNNASVQERNLSAAFGAGATPQTVDRTRIRRVENWIGTPESSIPEHYTPPNDRTDWLPHEGELAVPTYPFEVDKELAVRGRKLFDTEDSDPAVAGVQTCASCHAFDGQYIGQVVEIERIGTDPHRLHSFTSDLVANQNTLGLGFPWRFQHFRKTNGYANAPLDGVWARAPYLHNGAVPTLWDLLQAPENRPDEFLRGNDEFDQKKVGWVADRDRSPEGRELFRFNVNAVHKNSGNGGNGNGGHLYGLTWSDDEKWAVIEFMKTIGEPERESRLAPTTEQ